MKHLILTNHAKKRIIKAGLSPSIVTARFKSARRIKLSYAQKIYKNIKYGEVQDNIDYYHSAGLLYTVRIYSDHLVLLTVTKKPRSKIKYSNKLNSIVSKKKYAEIGDLVEYQDLFGEKKIGKIVKEEKYYTDSLRAIRQVCGYGSSVDSLDLGYWLLNNGDCVVNKDCDYTNLLPSHIFKYFRIRKEKRYK